MSYDVVPYNSQWPSMYELEKNAIFSALGNHCLCIHHIGSTSIPGISAKPTIDIIVAATDRNIAISSLKKIGYQYAGEWNIPFQCAFIKRGEINVNLHLFLDKNHPELEFNLKFRDYLRNNPNIRDQYSALKCQISHEAGSNERPTGGLRLYTIKKGPFIEDVMKKIDYNRLRVLKANTESQWNAAKSFCSQKEIILDGHEHLIFYRGVDIIGYADIRLHPEPMTVLVFEVNDQDAKPFFNEFLKKRLELPVSLHA